MTDFTPEEIEKMLRERWIDRDMEAFGGFTTPFEQGDAEREYHERFGDNLKGYTLLGSVSWSDYEEGAEYSLWERDSDKQLFQLHSGYSVYVGDYGDNFPKDLESVEIPEWIENVKLCLEHEVTG